MDLPQLGARIRQIANLIGLLEGTDSLLSAPRRSPFRRNLAAARNDLADALDQLDDELQTRLTVNPPLPLDRRDFIEVTGDGPPEAKQKDAVP